GIKNDELSKKIKQYNDDKIKIVIPPEHLEIWDTHHILVIHNEVYFYTNDNNSSFWIEDNKSIIKKKGQGSLVIVSNFLYVCYSSLYLLEADAI
ncbi:24736_t:CDS:1, partial [Racocetra persica]